MSLAESQINLIDVNFHLQTSLEIFDKNLADKIQSKKYQQIKRPTAFSQIRSEFFSTSHESLKGRRLKELQIVRFLFFFVILLVIYQIFKKIAIILTELQPP